MKVVRLKGRRFKETILMAWPGLHTVVLKIEQDMPWKEITRGMIGEPLAQQ